MKIMALGAVFIAGLIPGIPDRMWFFVLVGWQVFSCIVSGMPDPDEKSSNMYVWIFRTMHLLSQQGTRYFAHRSDWDTNLNGSKKSPDKP